VKLAPKKKQGRVRPARQESVSAFRLFRL